MSQQLYQTSVTPPCSYAAGSNVPRGLQGGLRSIACREAWIGLWHYVNQKKLYLSPDPIHPTIPYSSLCREGPFSHRSWPLWELSGRGDLFEGQETTQGPRILLITLACLKPSGGSEPLSLTDTWGTRGGGKWLWQLALGEREVAKGRNDHPVSSQAPTRGRDGQGPCGRRTS